MKTIKGKVYFILILSMVSLSAIILFSIYYFNEQSKMTVDMQDIQATLAQSEELKFEMANTRYQQQVFSNQPSEEQAEILLTSAESLASKTAQYEKENQGNEDIAASFGVIMENIHTYQKQIETWIELQRRIGFTEADGQMQDVASHYSNLYSLLRDLNNPEFTQTALSMRLNENKYLSSGNVINFSNFESQKNSLLADLNSEDTGTNAIRDIEEVLNNYQESIESVRNTLDQSEQITEEMSKLTGSINEEVQAINDLTVQQSQEMIHQQQKSQQLITTIFIITGVLILLIILIAGYVLNRSIIQSINHLKIGANRMGNGDLTYRVDVKGKDEMADLAESFNKMADKMNQSLVKVLKAANILSQSSGELTDISKKSSVQTNEVAEAINQVAVGAQEQAGQIEESTTLINHVTEAIDQTDIANGEILKELKEAEQDSQLGLEKVKTLEETSSSFIDLANHLTDEVRETAEQSRKITRIVSTIQEIADNTNLLALNAAIESARAGESGQGFAVVADEVRKLAERSKEEAEEIYQLMNNMNKQMANLSEEANQFGDYQKQQTQSVHETKTAFTNITEQVYGINEKMEEVSSSVSDIRQSNGDLRHKINEVSVIAEESVATAEEVAASGENQAETIDQLNQSSLDLHALSQELKAEVHEFSIHQETDDEPLEQDIDHQEEKETIEEQYQTNMDVPNDSSDQNDNREI
ncbi:HAMP domain-containing protein [Virgibacillus sp. MSP4-1]|uniref:methyl-accepting chemotaxis protein n=1 Tax=Virgibacillus sp. MSP4-1 TaxID=2700081 RepID=UPI00039E3E09|nr:methyl-accepting chemotaxis protein [Virgibacillus sp. MSP4-1]QHS23059.1 HAMP domain-containing protein [Virgibacillus sp. MSP4-1]